MDFVSLVGFLMTICQLALQVRGEEGEFNFFTLTWFVSARTHEICREVESDRPDFGLFDTV